MGGGRAHQCRSQQRRRQGIRGGEGGCREGGEHTRCPHPRRLRPRLCPSPAVLCSQSLRRPRERHFAEASSCVASCSDISRTIYTCLAAKFGVRHVWPAAWGRAGMQDPSEGCAHNHSLAAARRKQGGHVSSCLYCLFVTAAAALLLPAAVSTQQQERVDGPAEPTPSRPADRPLELWSGARRPGNYLALT